MVGRLATRAFGTHDLPIPRQPELVTLVPSQHRRLRRRVGDPRRRDAAVGAGPRARRSRLFSGRAPARRAVRPRAPPRRRVPARPQRRRRAARRRSTVDSPPIRWPRSSRRSAIPRCCSAPSRRPSRGAAARNSTRSSPSSSGTPTGWSTPLPVRVVGGDALRIAEAVRRQRVETIGERLVRRAAARHPRRRGAGGPGQGVRPGRGRPRRRRRPGAAARTARTRCPRPTEVDAPGLWLARIERLALTVEVSVTPRSSVPDGAQETPDPPSRRQSRSGRAAAGGTAGSAPTSCAGGAERRGIAPDPDAPGCSRRRGRRQVDEPAAARDADDQDAELTGGDHGDTRDHAGRPPSAAGTASRSWRRRDPGWRAARRAARCLEPRRPMAPARLRHEGERDDRPPMPPIAPAASPAAPTSPSAPTSIASLAEPTAQARRGRVAGHRPERRRRDGARRTRRCRRSWSCSQNAQQEEQEADRRPQQHHRDRAQRCSPAECSSRSSAGCRGVAATTSADSENAAYRAKANSSAGVDHRRRALGVAEQLQDARRAPRRRTR